MRKVLIITFLLFFNLLIFLGPVAQSRELKQVTTPFFCQNRSWFKRVSAKIFKTEDYLLILAKSQDYKQLLIQQAVLTKQLKKVEVLDSFDFKLSILKKGESYLLVDRSCLTKEDAQSNMKTLRFFFNIAANVISANPIHSFSRAPASVDSLLFVNND